MTPVTPCTRAARSLEAVEVVLGHVLLMPEYERLGRDEGQVNSGPLLTALVRLLRTPSCAQLPPPANHTRTQSYETSDASQFSLQTTSLHKGPI